MHHGKVTYKFIVAYLYTCIYKGVYMGFSVAQTYLSDILHTYCGQDAKDGIFDYCI